MLATAFALQQVTQQAVHDDTVMDMAAAIYQNKNEMTADDFINAMYQYSAFLSSLTASLATSVLLTESQFDEMIGSIKEMDALTKEIENGN